MKWFRDQFLFLVLLNHAEPFHLTYLGNTYSCYDKNVSKLFFVLFAHSSAEEKPANQNYLLVKYFKLKDTYNYDLKGF